MTNKYNPWNPLPKQIKSELMTYLNPIFESLDPNKIYIETLEIYRNPKKILKNTKNNGLEEHFNHSGRVSKKNSMNEWLITHNYDLVFLMTYKDKNINYDDRIKKYKHMIIKPVQTQIESEILKKIKNCNFVPNIKFPDLLKSQNIIVEEYISEGFKPIDYNNFEFMKKHQKLYTTIVADIFSELHRAGVIYDEEIPHHFLIENTGTTAKLIDFGNSSFGTSPGQYHGEIIRIIAHMQKHKINKKNIENFIDKYRLNIEEYEPIDNYILLDNDSLRKDAKHFLKNKPKGLRI